MYILSMKKQKKTEACKVSKPVLGSSQNEGQIPIGDQPGYTPTYPSILKKVQEPVLVYNHGSQVKEPAREPASLCQLFPFMKVIRSLIF